MELDSRNHIDWNVLFRGGFEPVLTQVMVSLLPKAGVAIDVGANIGVHTLTMARLVGPAGRVLAFEPNPTVRQSMERNVLLNDFAEVVSSHDCALGDQQTSMELKIPRQDSKEGSNLGLASLVALDSPHDTVAVSIRTGDSVLQEDRDVNRLDLVKIDVQGFEYRVLKGLHDSLQRYRPALIIEFDRWCWQQGGSSLLQGLDFLDSVGYECQYVATEGLKSIDSLPEPSLLEYADLIALPRGDKRASWLGGVCVA